MNENSLDYAGSAALAVAIKAQPQRCWRNAALAVLTVPALTLATYVEGWIVLARAYAIDIRAHGWCRVPGGGIVDPTLVLHEGCNQPVTYFPGVEYSRHSLRQELPGQTVPLVCNTHYGEDGMGHMGYHMAYEQAWQTARAEAARRHLPATAIQMSTRDATRGITMFFER